MDKVSTQSHDQWSIIITTDSDLPFHRKLNLLAIKRPWFQIRQSQTGSKSIKMHPLLAKTTSVLVPETLVCKGCLSISRVSRSINLSRPRRRSRSHLLITALIKLLKCPILCKHQIKCILTLMKSIRIPLAQPTILQLKIPIYLIFSRITISSRQTGTIILMGTKSCKKLELNNL